MKTVVISGYYGYENVGDEALLASIISALRFELPNVKIIVLSAQPAKTASLYSVEAINRVSLGSVIMALRRADLLISGGGSLLQDVTGALTIPYYLGIVALAKILGKKVMLYAQGIGPVHKIFGKLLIRLIVDRVDLITLRDTASADLLSRLGVRKPPIQVTADPVFGFQPDQDSAASAVLEELRLTPEEKPLIGIFVREWQGFTGYKKAVAGLADHLCRTGRQVIFVPMQCPRDLLPAQDIVRLMAYRPMVVEQGLSFSRLTSLINGMGLVVGMRLHALISAAVCTVPMVGLSYDPKVTDFLHEIDQPVFEDIERVTAEELIHKVEEVLARQEAVRASLADRRADLHQKALANSHLAVQLLNNDRDN